jgi:phage gpG-like protein
MASFEITIHVGDVVHVLTIMEAAFENPAELMKDVLLTMIRSTQLTFEANGRPSRWDDLKESTERKRFAKAMRGQRARNIGALAVLGGLQILRDTGLLAQSVGGGASGAFDTSDGFGDSDQLSAIIGTNRPGWQNQFPDSRGWRVAREFLLIQDQDEEDIAAMALDWFLRRGPYAA